MDILQALGKNESYNTEERFNMGKLLELYQENISLGREYLYQHMSVFSSVREISNLGKHAKDIYHDIFLVVDEMIQKSIEQGYEEKQIYNYVKRRISGEIINRSKKYFNESLGYIDLSAEDKEDKEDYEDIINNLENGYLVVAINDMVLAMNEPYKTIMLLLHYTTPPYTFKQIGRYLGVSEQKVSFEYEKILKFIKGMIDEDND